MNRSLPPAVRRLVLACAMLAATLAALLPGTPAVRAASGGPALVLAQSAAGAARDAAREAADAARQAATEAADEAKAAAAAASDGEDRPHRRGLSMRIDGLDHQYDSFDQFLERDPGLASMVLGIVFIVFLTPILIIALIIWYKMRKNRMQNEMVLKLAERGVVPPADAIRAVGNGRIDAVVGAATGGLPLAEQAQLVNKRAAWSDLRKGVIMGTIGLALTLYAIIEEASASWIGLVLLFVGIGYIVLWYFEERQASTLGAPRAMPTAPVRGPGDTTP